MLYSFEMTPRPSPPVAVGDTRVMRLRDRKITFGKYQRKMSMRPTTAVSYRFSLEGLGPSAGSEVARGSLVGGWKHPAVLGLTPLLLLLLLRTVNPGPGVLGSACMRHLSNFRSSLSNSCVL